MTSGVDLQWFDVRDCGNLSYPQVPDLLGGDGEGTLDGIHPNDLGFMRMAESLYPALRKLCRK